MSLDRRIRLLRAAKGLNQEAFGEVVGVTAQAVNQWETPERPGQKRKPPRPSKERLVRIAAAFDVREQWLLSGGGPMTEADVSSEDVSSTIGDGRDVGSEDVSSTIDNRDIASAKAKPPFHNAIPQIAGKIGGGSTNEVITVSIGGMMTREPVLDWWHIPSSVLRSLGVPVNRIIALQSDGLSMEPTILRTDIVFLDTGFGSIIPDAIWAVDYGFGRTLKRVVPKHTSKGIRYLLRSDNPAYDEENYAPDEVTIIGRYLWRMTVF